MSPAPQGLLTGHSSFPAWTRLSYLFGSCWSLAGSCLSSLFIYFYQFLKGQCKWEFLCKNPFSSPRLESITPSTKAPAFWPLWQCSPHSALWESQLLANLFSCGLWGLWRQQPQGLVLSPGQWKEKSTVSGTDGPGNNYAELFPRGD